MLILWIRKAKNSERTSEPKNDEESFPKHDKAMKKFRLSHPKIEAGVSEDIITPDGLVLAPVQHVKLSQHAQN